MVVVVAGSHYMASVFEKPITVRIADEATVQGEAAKADFKKDLIIVSYLSYRERRSKNQLHILGKIKNSGAIAWTGIEIQAELFNKGQYVDECHESIRILMPNEEDNFIITCGECAEDTMPEHDKIKLKIAAAHRD